MWPVHDADAFRGPFDVPPTSPTPLVVATTYDPATPYAGALGLVEELGNARLLTMEGDGHGAYGRNSACVNSVTEAYLFDLTLPAAGTVCQQDVVVTAPAPVPTGASAATALTLLPGR
jgi:TAP-like protein